MREWEPYLIGPYDLRPIHTGRREGEIANKMQSFSMRSSLAGSQLVVGPSTPRAVKVRTPNKTASRDRDISRSADVHHTQLTSSEVVDLGYKGATPGPA